MGQEIINLPKTPIGWAVRISRIINAVRDTHGFERGPLDVSEIARDISQNFFPDEPITLVEGQPFGSKFEGALIRKTKTNEWGILYNSDVKSFGRRNFTLAHELGHYLLHRHYISDSIQCDKSDLLSRDTVYAKREAEANEFASHLLIPLDDFRLQTARFRRPRLNDFSKLKEHYGVSLTAVVLKWLEITKSRAMIVISRDGYVDWAWCSSRLLKSGFIIRARKEVTALPMNSLAATKCNLDETYFEENLDKGCWSRHEPVLESTIFSRSYDMAISLVIFPPRCPFGLYRDNAESDQACALP